MSLRRQIWVVLLSYLTRSGFRWAVVALGSGFALMLIGAGCGKMLALRPGDENPFSFLILIGAMTIGMSLIVSVIVFLAHARQQLMGPDMRLMPNTRTANLVVVGTLFFAIAGAISLPAYDDSNLFFPAFFMIVLSVMTLIAWAVCNPWLTPIPVIVLLLASYNNAVQFCIAAIVHGDHWGTLVPRNEMVAEIWKERERNQLALRVILVLANILGLLVLERLSRPRTSSFLLIRVTNWIANFWQPVATAQPQRRHPFIESHFARSLHRRFAIHNWYTAVFLAALMALVGVALCRVGGTSDSLVPLTATLAIIPGALVAIGWRDRWRSYEFETLYPVKQQQFISELLTVLLLDAGEFWIATLAGLLIPLIVMRAEMLREPHFWAAVIAGGMLQFLWIGGIALAGQRRQTLPFAAALGLVALTILVTFDQLRKATPHVFPNRFVAIAGIEMLAGLLLLTTAVYAWRRRAGA